MVKKLVACAALLALLPGAAVAAQNTHVVSRGDTLWSLYGKYCGDSFGWDNLYQANRGVVSDPHRIYPDMKLSVPSCDVKPSRQLAQRPDAEEPQLLAAVPAESAVAEEGQPEVPQAQEPAAAEQKTAVPGPAIEPRGGYKTIEAVAAQPEISEDMPKDMAWGVPTASSELLPEDWKPDGKVRYANVEDKFDDFATDGDLVEVRMASGVKLKPGDYLKVYRLGVLKKNDKGKVIGQLAQPSALLKVATVDGKKVRAAIVRLFNPVGKDDPVKKL